MISKILVSIDQTDASLHALTQASVLARSEKSRLVLLSVIPTYNGDLRMMGNQSVLYEMRVSYQGALKEAEQTVQQFNLPAKAILDEGEPFSRILQQAEQENVDLVVMNKNQTTVSDRIPIGEITSKVIHQGSRDILVVPEKADLHLERILLVFDKTEAARIALNKAIEISVAYGSELTILTVFEVPLEGFSYSPDLWEKDTFQAKLLQTEAKEIAEQKGVRNLKTILRHGKASTEICEVARSTMAGLIIMGADQQRALKTFLPGNVIEAVVRNRTTPVWISKH